MPAVRTPLVSLLIAASSLLAHGQQAGTAPIVQAGAPGQPSKTVTPADVAKARPLVSSADVDFMQGMVMHHGQAVTMTDLIAARTENPEVRAIGSKIHLSQTDEMKFMKSWLTARGRSTHMQVNGMDADMPGMNMGPMPMMPGMLTPAQMDALSKAHGTAFDRLFLTGMMQHHNGALVMVNQLFASAGAGQDADLFDFATDVDNTQRAEIRIMQGLLDHLDSVPSSQEKP